MFSSISSCRFPSASAFFIPPALKLPLSWWAARPMPWARSFPIIGGSWLHRSGWAAPSCGLAASLAFPLGPIAPEPASASAAGPRTLTETTGTGVRQAGLRAGSTTYTLVMTPWSRSDLPWFLCLVTVGNNTCPTGLGQRLMTWCKFLAQCQAHRKKKELIDIIGSGINTVNSFLITE